MNASLLNKSIKSCEPKTFESKYACFSYYFYHIMIKYSSILFFISLDV